MPHHKMKKNLPGTYIFLIILIGIVGCQRNSNQRKGQSQGDKAKPESKIKLEKAAKAFNCETTLVSQEFSYNALAFDTFKADTNKIKSLFLDRVTLKMDETKDEEGMPYYLHNFTDGVNKIILMYNNGFYIKDAEINNNRVLLNKKISIGMKKDIFLGLLKANNTRCDTITVHDEEFAFESVYIFKGDTLRQVFMGGNVE